MRERLWDKIWITPDGEVIPVRGEHQAVSKKVAGIDKDEAIRRGWIRAIQVPRFGDFWWFETQNAFDGRTLAIIEAFTLSPDNVHRGDAVAAGISTVEPERASFPIEWKDLEEGSFQEAAEKAFRKELHRKVGYRWYELRGRPRA